MAGYVAQVELFTFGCDGARAAAPIASARTAFMISAWRSELDYAWLQGRAKSLVPCKRGNEEAKKSRTSPLEPYGRVGKSLGGLHASEQTRRVFGCSASLV
jgi:hypothetical protein